jgi:hypothetical protein
MGFPVNQDQAHMLALKARFHLADPSEVVPKQLGNGEWVVVARYQFGDFYIWSSEDILIAPKKGKGYAGVDYH